MFNANIVTALPEPGMRVHPDARSVSGPLGRAFARADGPALPSGFPGAALTASAAGALLDANPKAQALADAWDDPRDDSGRALKRLAAEAAAAGAAQARIVLGGGALPDDARRSFDCTAIAAQGGVLVLAQEVTLERNMMRALVASRAFFRDLLRCSSDVAWETDAAGAFLYCGAPGLAGWSPQELNGRRGDTLLVADGPSPFCRTEAVDGAEVWVAAAEGARRCLRVSARPVFADDGAFRGARGLARDVTEDVVQAAELARLQEDERLKAAILAAIHAELAPADMRAAAVEVVRAALNADCAVLLPPGQTPSADEATHVAVATAFKGEVNGLVLLERVRGFSAADRTRAQNVAAHVGLALAHADQLEKLSDEARRDPLTGLLNRRAFEEEAGRRLAAAARGDRRLALVYFDVDAFKSINDLFGHRMGDAVLEGIGAFLRGRKRTNDLAVRFGGDEFGVLLEDCDRAGAAGFAEGLGAAAPAIGAGVGLQAALTFSIGAALSLPGGGEALDALVARADAALYASKRGGRNRWTIAAEEDAPC